MPVSKINWEIATLLEAIGEAREGHVSVTDDEDLYIRDTKIRVVNIQKALDDLKIYLDKLGK